MSAKYRQLRSRFKKIAKVLRSNQLDDSDINSLKDDVFKQFDILKRTIDGKDLKHITPQPLKDRFVSIQIISKGNSKITYRPESGECLLKLNCLDKMHPAAVRFANKVIEEIDDDLRVTLRGRLYWSDSRGEFYATLRSNGKGERYTQKINFKN